MESLVNAQGALEAERSLVSVLETENEELKNEIQNLESQLLEAREQLAALRRDVVAVCNSLSMELRVLDASSDAVAEKPSLAVQEAA